MKDFLSGLLEGRGVSASVEDIMLVLEACRPYLIGIGCALILLIVLLILARVLKTKKIVKGTIRFQSLAAFIIAVVVLVNLLCNGPVSTLLNVSMGAKGEGMTEETHDESYAVAKQIAEEGIVLLKNKDSVLPFSSDVKKLNVFGWASTNPIYGGTGSGEFSDTSSMVSLLQGLEDAGYEVNPDIVAFYEKEEDTRPEIGMYIQDWTNPEAKIKDYDKKKIFDGAKAFFNWCAGDSAQNILVNDAGLVSPFDDCQYEAVNPFYKSMNSYITAGNYSGWHTMLKKDGLQNETCNVFADYAKGKLDADGFVSTIAQVISAYYAQ